ncbi:MAG: IclR family transcriptional regulator [Alphaproteobacteria bacterium]|nr:IclR family transcriptional regulator [Alphaproteobacteria bacterium]
MRDDTSRSSAIGKSVLILEALANAGHAMSAVDLALMTGFNRQTVHRLLSQLEDLEIVHRDLRKERYRLGTRFGRLAVKGLATMANNKRVHEILEGLVAEVRETCNIGVLDGNEVVYIDRVECDWPLRVQLQAGSRVPAYCTAIGKLLLAHRTPGQLEQYLNSVRLTPLNDNTITDAATLRAALEAIRNQRFSINNQEDSIGLLAVAVPILGADKSVLGGLALHGPEARLTESRAMSLVGRLRSAASDISKVLFAESAPCETAD